MINSDGAVLSSNGELVNDENVAGAMTKIVQTATKIPISGEGEDSDL